MESELVAGSLTEPDDNLVNGTRTPREACGDSEYADATFRIGVNDAECFNQLHLPIGRTRSFVRLSFAQKRAGLRQVSLQSLACNPTSQIYGRLTQHLSAARESVGVPGNVQVRANKVSSDFSGTGKPLQLDRLPQCR